MEKNNKKKDSFSGKKDLGEFHSITGKKKPENQNQEHNVRKEGTGSINQKR